MADETFGIKGLTVAEVTESRIKFGANIVINKTQNAVVAAIISLAKEPMVVLLLVASVIYYISGNTPDGIFLSVAIVLVAGISLYQDARSNSALEKLKVLTSPLCKVIRDGRYQEINSADLVIGDVLVAEEGNLIAADGLVLRANDFTVNESVLTGESLPVDKNAEADNQVYQGCTVATGLAVAKVTAIGGQTRLGHIGIALKSITEEKTPLEKQINNFVKKMVVLGTAVFLTVWAINYFHTLNLLDSLLKALTLAMSILPEEIPVAFATFMALGAWRLMQMGVLVKHTKTVETLGSATVICTDKTGTITENRMSLAMLYVPLSKKIVNADDDLGAEEKELINTAMWASEPIPFDPMEKALHNSYAQAFSVDERPGYKMAHEYPLAGHPPMMTHIFEDRKGSRIIAAKGAPEALMAVSDLNLDEKKLVNDAIYNFAAKGYRVLGVGEAHFAGNNFPENQQEFKFTFKGLVAFYDPPKKNIMSVLQTFYNAGIKVKIVTGDYTATTMAIASQVGLMDCEQSVTGDELLQLNEHDAEKKVKNTNIFSRMFPDAKLRLINALKKQGEIVAMIGDGVNDGPALKAAHIGIAMGNKGSEIAKQAASMVLVDDDPSKMALAVAMGRRIYSNLKKAIQYIISIHIPIVLTVFVPLALGWKFPNIFSPVHIIFLELIMGPTCSIIYENEPAEKNIMLQSPRPFSHTFFSARELITSILQGLVITAGALFVYQHAVHSAYNEPTTRAMVFTALIAANITLTIVNRSFYYSVFTTMRYKNNLVWLIIGITIVLLAILIYVRPLAIFFGFSTLAMQPLLISISAGFISAIWFEAVKLVKRRRAKNQ